jgi:hypothetical protein
VHSLRCRRQRITVLADRRTEAQAMAMMDSDTIAHRIFAAYCGAGLVFALFACALTQ